MASRVRKSLVLLELPACARIGTEVCKTDLFPSAGAAIRTATLHPGRPSDLAVGIGAMRFHWQLKVRDN